MATPLPAPDRDLLLGLELFAAARAALDAADPAAYAAVLQRDEEIADLHRRHQARLRLAEEGLVARPAAPAAVARTMVAAAQRLTAWLEGDAAEPDFLNYLGVFAAELGAFKEAAELLEAALRLDDALPGAAQALATARRRHAERGKVVGLPADAARTLKALRPRWRRIAAAARPAEGLRISLCMIVRDEEELLPQCLAAVADGVDEMVVVDTGSRDRTVEIAESFGARVLHFPWTGDFGAARNVGLDAATGDWLLILDADEVFQEGHAARLKELATRSWREGFYFQEVNHLGGIDDGNADMHDMLRLIRNRPAYRYEGTVHEQIVAFLPTYLASRFERTALRVDHYGYLGTVREEKGKSTRNLELLRQQHAEGDDSAFLHFNLGSEYLAGQQLEQAIVHLDRSWELAEREQRPGFIVALSRRLVQAHFAAGHREQAGVIAAEVHELLPGFTDVYFDQGRAALAAGDLAEARRLFERCLELGDAPSAYMPMVGCGGHLAELQLAQLEAIEGDRPAALTRLWRVRRSQPGHLAVIDPLVQSLLDEGSTPEHVVAQILEHGDLSPSGWFMLAVNFQERAHFTQAEAAFRSALERRPTFDTARVGLADALLVQHRVEEAAAAAEAVPADGRVGGAAVRTALFALLALDEAPELAARRRAQLERLPQTRLSDAEQDVLRAWHAARSGGMIELPGAGAAEVNAITPMLSALLRLGAADAFADLVQVLHATGLPDRELRHALAMLLLGAGLADLAGAEWIGLVNAHGPDAGAFAGLADVARLQGLPDDAENFAREALALEPGHAMAERVLAALVAPQGLAA